VRSPNPVTLPSGRSVRYSRRSVELSLWSRRAVWSPWSVSRAGGWYDLTVTFGGRPDVEYRYAGHLEDGEDSISDPGMGGLV
jgi:phospholipase C